MAALARIRKALVPVAGAGIAAAAAIWGPANPWIGVAVLVLTALGVYHIPNARPGNDTPAEHSDPKGR